MRALIADYRKLSIMEHTEIDIGSYLLRIYVIFNGFLQTLANALLRDTVQVARCENVIDDCNVESFDLWRH